MAEKQKIGQKVMEIEKLARQGVKKTFLRLPYILLMLVTFLVTGFAEFITQEFDWRIFISPSYWFNVVLVAVGGFCMAFASTLFFSQNIKERDEDKKFHEANSALAKITPNIQDTDLDLFLEEINVKRKSEAYNLQVNKQIEKIDKKMKTEDILQYAKIVKTQKNFTTKQVIKYEVIGVNEEGQEIKKETITEVPTDYEEFSISTLELLKEDWITSDLAKQKAELLLKINPQFVEENIRFYNVKYKKITHKLISVGYQGKGDDDMPNSSMVVLTNALLPRSLFSIAVTTILLSFAFDIAQLSWLAILPVFVKIGGLISHLIYGRNFADTYVEQVDLYNILVKIRWLTRYDEWKKKKNKKVEQNETLTQKVML